MGSSWKAAAFVTEQSIHVLTSSSAYQVSTSGQKSSLPLALSDSGNQYFANSHTLDESYLQWRGNAGPAVGFNTTAEKGPGGAAIVNGASWGTAVLNIAPARRRSDLSTERRYHIARLWRSAPLGYTREYPVIPCVPDRAGPPYLTATSSAVLSIWFDGEQLAAGLCLDESALGRPVSEGLPLPALGELEATRVLHAAVADGRLEVVIDVDRPTVRHWLPSLCPDHTSVVAVGSAALSSLGETPGPGRDGWAGILSFPDPVTWATGVGGLGSAPRRQVFVSGGKVFLFSEKEGLCGLDGLDDTVVEQVAGRGDGFILALGKREGESVLWKLSDVRYEQ